MPKDVHDQFARAHSLGSLWIDEVLPACLAPVEYHLRTFSALAMILAKRPKVMCPSSLAPRCDEMKRCDRVS